MIITFFRSSSLSQYIDMCHQQYFITYVLGQPSPPNMKADLGSITHLALEWLSLLKIQYDKGNERLKLKTSAIDLDIDREDIYIPTSLKDSDIDKINYSRRNKQIYLPTARLPYGQVRYGSKVVNKLITDSYTYFSTVVSPDHPWTNASYKQAWNWTWMALEQNNRAYDPRFRTIIAPEQKFDLKIEKDWAKYEFYLKGEKVEGYLGLKGTIDLVTKVDDNTIEIIDWKALPIETLLPTPDGWTTMGEVQVGDVLFDKNGKKTKVVGKSKVKQNKCYKIYFDDKTTVVSDVDHIWHLHDGKNKPAHELKVKDKISVTKAIETEQKDLPIDPYVLGLWLGNGRNRGGEICSAYDFVFEEIVKRGYEIGEDIGGKNRCQSHTVLGLTDSLRKLNLLHSKHIPDIYLRASISQRLDLLRGLMDSDGNVNVGRKQAVFTSCSKTLSDDVKKLLITLGQRVNQSNLNRDTNFKKNINVYPLHFRPLDINPFLVPEKADRIDPEWGPGQSNIRRIVKIEELEGEKTVQCIKVDSPSNTFLCTENMIPTHNTGKMFNWGKNEAKTFESLHEDKQLMFYYYAARQIFPQYKNIIITINFIRDGGAQTIAFDDSILEATENMIRQTFEEIKANEKPKLLDPTYNDHRCRLFCPFFKKKIGATPYCRYIADRIDELGIEYVTDTEMREGFTPGYYESPGE